MLEAFGYPTEVTIVLLAREAEQFWNDLESGHAAQDMVCNFRQT